MRRYLDFDSSIEIDSSSSYPVKFIIESTCIAHWFPRPVSPPQSCGGRIAIRTLSAHASLGVLQEKPKERGLSQQQAE